jgi:23S rRNA (cytidine2498-2'-O)-methyltransferase
LSNLNYLVSCDAESDALLLEELRRMGGVELPGVWMDTGDAVQGSILRVAAGEDFPARLEAYGSIFVRHLAPVQYDVPLQGEEADIERIAGLLPELRGRLEAGRSFSVQSRVLGEGKLPFRKVVLNERLSQALEADAVRMDCRHPEQVVSILCTPDRAYVGVSPTEQNRSEWPGGKHRFKRDDDQISRAEFKLLEALSVFGRELPSHGHALDIGASPGGWTRVLAAHGLRVDAVDPGHLDPRLKGNRLVRHHRKRIQEVRFGPLQFDAIVNDMKMDARDSIEIMLGLADRLRPGGLAIMTLKMPKSGPAPRMLDMLREDLDRLATGFEVAGARQLYHNRSEVTVAMQGRA